MDDFETDSVSEDPLYDDPTASTADYDYSDLMCDLSPVRAFRQAYEPPLFWMIAVVGFLGNMAVVWIYLNYRRRLKTMTDVFLLNLAVADLLFLVTLPLWAAEASSSWTFGAAVCKMTSAVYKVNLFSSTLLLTCISVDRYVVIVQTTKARNLQAQRRRCARLACAVVWLTALLLATPELAFATVAPAQTAEGPVDFCRMLIPARVGRSTKTATLSLQVLMGFCLPFTVMAICYGAVVATLLKTRSFQKHKAMRVVLAVVAVFLLTQLPHNAVLVTEAAQAADATITDCQQLKAFLTAGQVLKGVAYLHACLNPFLYAFVGVRFRRDLLQLVRFRSRRRTSTISGKSTPGSARVSDSDTSQALSL
ncbi:C-C chemokine receptor type 9a [Corythoichthys intestinalis]|uniref:C-C chemokine receptor type 9a n=1 Tax=Corythoichthys intestinalis TaxID=161448 RepID=UPI0025A603D6|nr:C-C chemokine receptor type 9a [Corythoichthys intestinalis]XP_061795354.1 C-C chemokine receptor type 9-like [Nerophis lumbriciformis]